MAQLDDFHTKLQREIERQHVESIAELEYKKMHCLGTLQFLNACDFNEPKQNADILSNVRKINPYAQSAIPLMPQFHKSTLPEAILFAVQHLEKLAGQSLAPRFSLSEFRSFGRKTLKKIHPDVNPCITHGLFAKTFPIYQKLLCELRKLA